MYTHIYIYIYTYLHIYIHIYILGRRDHTIRNSQEAPTVARAVLSQGFCFRFHPQLTRPSATSEDDTGFPKGSMYDYEGTIEGHIGMGLHKGLIERVPEGLCTTPGDYIGTYADCIRKYGEYTGLYIESLQKGYEASYKEVGVLLWGEYIGNLLA